MSCGSSCPCHFKWLVDTQGSKRDPINSEKAWLDFSVRLLSREVVGKGKGQETVWSERCKPHWWDKVVGLPWKNPTANPKDTKEVLLTKYTALERKLREEGRFPQELEEEAKLWSEGKYKELFLQTSLASLLGKVTGVHVAVIDALEKVKELKAQVNLSLVNDLQQCLSSTLHVTNNLSINGCNNMKPAKRSSPGIDISDAILEKRKKVERAILPLDKQAAYSAAPMSFKTAQEMSLQQEFTANRKCQTRTNSAKRYKQKLQPKPPTPAPVEQSLVTMAVTIADPLKQVRSTSGLRISQEAISHLLLGKLIVCANPTLNTTPALIPTPIRASNIHVTNSLKFSENSKPSLHSQVPVAFNSKSDSPSENTDILFSSKVPNSLKPHSVSGSIHSSNIPDIHFLLSSVESNSNSNTTPAIVHDSCSSNNSVHSPLFNENDIATGNTSSVDFPSRSSSVWVESVDITSDSETDHNISDTDYSTEHSMLEYSTDHSMLDYSTEHSMLDLDDLYSPKEQEQLWKEDGSYLLERFLEDLDGTVQGSTTTKLYH